MLKYPNTIDRDRVHANIADLERQGWPTKIAIIEAYNAARKSYFSHYKWGVCPVWMAWPKTARARTDYHADGSPRPPGPSRNPARRAQVPAKVRQAARLFHDFTGHDVTRQKQVNVPPIDVGLAIGPVLGIIYQTTRDGVKENYIHKFHKVNARPLLIASSDGRQIGFLGGGFQFTERGFVDD